MPDPDLSADPWRPPVDAPAAKVFRPSADGGTFPIDRRRWVSLWPAHARDVWPAAYHPVLLASPSLLPAAALLVLAVRAPDHPGWWLLVAMWGLLAALWMGTAWRRLAAFRLGLFARSDGRTATVRLTPHGLQWEAPGVELRCAWPSVRAVTRVEDTVAVWGPMQLALPVDLQGAPPGAADDLVARIEERRRSASEPEPPVEGVALRVRGGRWMVGIRAAAVALMHPSRAVLSVVCLGVFAALALRTATRGCWSARCFFPRRSSGSCSRASCSRPGATRSNGWSWIPGARSTSSVRTWSRSPCRCVAPGSGACSTRRGSSTATLCASSPPASCWKATSTGSWTLVARPRQAWSSRRGEELQVIRRGGSPARSAAPPG